MKPFRTCGTSLRRVAWIAWIAWIVWIVWIATGLVLAAPAMSRAATAPRTTTSVGQASSANSAATFARVTVHLYGVFSPRGFFNIMVRVNQLQGVERAKFDLKESRLTLDFAPGVAVNSAEIRNVMVNAGYSPGPFQIQQIPVTAPPDHRPGWVKIKHPHSRWALVRWLEVNF